MLELLILFDRKVVNNKLFEIHGGFGYIEPIHLSCYIDSKTKLNQTPDR